MTEIKHYKSPIRIRITVVMNLKEFFPMNGLILLTN